MPLRHALTLHEVATAYERGWSMLKNGELLDAAEKDGFAALVTTDTNLQYQQNLKARRPRIQRALGEVVRAVDGAIEATFTQIDIP